MTRDMLPCDSQRHRAETSAATDTHRAQRRSAIVVFLLTLSGCVQEMAEQPRVDTLEPAAFQGESYADRAPPEGTIARGHLPVVAPFTTGRHNGEPLAEFPEEVEVNVETLRRGRERYSIFCQHCHGISGYGDGMVVQRGFPAPPSYHTERLRDLEIGRVFDVITNGRGRMPAFGRRIPPADRWAIIAYIQALQLSQHARLDELSTVDQDQLQHVEPRVPPAGDPPANEER